MDTYSANQSVIARLLLTKVTLGLGTRCWQSATMVAVAVVVAENRTLVWARCAADGLVWCSGESEADCRRRWLHAACSLQLPRVQQRQRQQQQAESERAFCATAATLFAFSP